MTADFSAVGGTEDSETLDTVFLVVGSADGSDVGGADDFGAAFLAGFACHHPSLLCALSHSCKWGNMVPMSISL